ncbi:hypothetical protein IL992_33285 [Microbispora sp. NEAU-D428]|uniref:hypothetical protein n=1 Tax=Microbispora sitophila TaxID=2771537 RepID=UPI001867C8E2|nr:hypothetical protein [Microbispora sitophila]MBE3014017.1 hypothetical protein [Microbispora sitophila]
MPRPPPSRLPRLPPSPLPRSSHADPFEVYSDLIGRLVPVHRRRDAVVACRNSLDGMAGLQPAPGLTALVVVLGDTLQVTVIVIGHVLGTVLAHDRALALFPRRTAVLGQIPLLVLMVVYTIVGLLLLFAA